MNTQYRTRRITLMLAGLAAVLGVSSNAAWPDGPRSADNFIQTTALMAPGAALQPNGVDDTEALQSALDSCSGTTSRCVIHLAAGDFYTNMLVAYNFNGTIRGQGADRTVIHPVANQTLRGNGVDPFWAADPTPEAPWPYLMTFVDGRINLTNLGIEFPDGPLDIVPWLLCDVYEEVIGGAIVATGRTGIDIGLKNVSITGGYWEDGVFGANVFNAVFYQSLLFPVGAPQIDWCGGEPAGDDFIRVGGQFRAISSTFGNVLGSIAVYVAANLDLHISNNVFYNVLLGPDVEDVLDSTVNITHNTIDAMLAGVELVQGNDASAPTGGGTSYQVTNNDIAVNMLGNSPFGGWSGVDYLDYNFDTATDNLLQISSNTIHLGVEVLDGIFVLGDENASQIIGNTIDGTAAYAGVDVDATTGCHVAGNSFPGFTGGLAEIYLGPDTTQCHVVAPAGTVWDDGTDNTIETP